MNKKARLISNILLGMFCKEAAFHYRNRFNVNLCLTSTEGQVGMIYAIIFVFASGKKKQYFSHIDFTKKKQL